MNNKFVLALLIFFLVLFSPPKLISAETKSFEKLFYIVDGKSGLESLKKHADLVDIVAPQSYTISAALGISGSVNSEIKNLAQEHGIKIMPLVVNAGFRQDIIHRLLTAPTTTQDALINFMIKEAVKNKYVGWQFDFEHIYFKDRDAYSLFVEKTAAAFKGENLLLSVAAVARSNDVETDFYKNWSGAFDYQRIAQVSDFISIMTYDDPTSVGPSASMPFVRSVYAYLKDKVPPPKLSLGVPFYYWGWSISPTRRVRSGGTYQRLQYLRSAYKTIEGFNSNYAVPYLIYFAGKKGYVIWHEDEKSFKSKLDFAKENNLRGFSAWVLGLENPSVWKVLASP